MQAVVGGWAMAVGRRVDGAVVGRAGAHTPSPLMYAARWINRQDALRVTPCLIHVTVPVRLIVGVVISAGPIGRVPPLHGCEI